MIRRRITPDGLPYRLYERRGVRVYSIGYKLKSGKWAFRYECPVTDLNEVARLRRKAIEESTRIRSDRPIGGFEGLVKAWFDWQEALPLSSTKKRAASTIAENKRESVKIVTAFGHLQLDEITKTMGYEYLDACEAGNRPEKGNKEISLARVILEYGVRLGMIEANPFDGLRKNKTVTKQHYVENSDLSLALEVGRSMGGPYHIQALCLKTAYLCVGRSVEARAFTINHITDAGLVWHDGKTKTKAPTLFSWTPELRAIVDEALAVKRNHVAGSMFLFGNMQGQRYTKSGWGKLLGNLMDKCELVAAERKIEFHRFNLQHCRPKGVSDKLNRGDLDTRDATRHTSEKMISTVYDRRKMKKSTPSE
jgi:integrase